MMWRTTLLILLGAGTASSDEVVTLERVTALAKVYFRDSAEVPMLVDVTTVVTNQSGKVTHHGHSTVGMVFNGYNQQSGKFSFRANSGIFSTGALHDSLSGGFAAFFAGGLITKPTPTRSFAIQQAAETGKPVVVTVADKNCPALQMIPGASFPPHICGLGQFHLGNGPNGDLTFQNFTFETTGTPAMAKLPHLGDAQLLSFHAEVTFQQGSLPGDPKPYLWPKETVTTLFSDKGKVTITNLYRPKK